MVSTQSQVSKFKKPKVKKVAGTRTRDVFSFDYSFLFIVIFIIAFGLIMIYSASEYSSQQDFGNTWGYFRKQLFSVIIGAGAMALAFFINYRVYNRGRVPWIIFIVSLISMFALFSPLGITINGARRWLDLKVTTLQPAEFVKIGVIILTASLICLSTAKFVRFKKIFRIWVFTGIIPAAIVYLVSSNLSSAIIVVLISLLMTFVAYSGYKPYVFLIAIGIVIALAAVMYGNNADPDSGSFRLNRIAVWLHPEDYAETTGYQTVQSLYAIGSGGFFGKGLGRSMQKLSFIPEAQNDMIFAVICEELGIFGAILVVSLFIFLLWRILVIARRAPDRFGMLICMGVFFHIAIQVFLNIAVATNLIPNTGVTLPFISYGGSSILFLMYEMGMVLNVSRQIKEQEQ